MDIIHDQYRIFSLKPSKLNDTNQIHPQQQNGLGMRRRECKSTSDESPCTFDAISSETSRVFTNAVLNPTTENHHQQNNNTLKISEGTFGANALNIIKSVHVSPSTLGKLKFPKEKRVKRLTGNPFSLDKKQNCKCF